LYEGFGLPPLEAMASGTPVVTSNMSSLPEVTGDAAVQVDPYDASAIADGIYRVLTDESLRNDLKRRGLDRATQFSWESSVRRGGESEGQVGGGGGGPEAGRSRSFTTGSRACAEARRCSKPSASATRRRSCSRSSISGARSRRRSNVCGRTPRSFSV